MRSATAGATIANEIRAIASGLAGKDLGVIQIKDLMLDTLAKERADREEKSKSKSRRRRDDIATSDRIAAENYYKLWSQSIKEKVKSAETGKGTSPVKRSRPRPDRKRATT